MLKRYTLPDMKKLWLDLKTKFEYWLEVEKAYLEARFKAGNLDRGIYQDIISSGIVINPDRIDELEAEYNHDFIAFVVSVQEYLVANGWGHCKEEFHRYLTSFDIEDPALVLMLREAMALIRQSLFELYQALRQKAVEHQWTLMIARTHGQFAEPDTFGHLLLVFSESIKRSINRVDRIMIEELGEAKISGAVGNFAGMDPRIGDDALAILGLKQAPAETQILQRDRHAALMSVLAIAAASIEQIARTFWEMMRSDVGELREPRSPRQRGSSAMAHKRNPILTERLMGMAIEVRGHTGAAFENIATPECRDISQSNVEREGFPTATGLVHYMANKMKWLVQNLEVFPERMKQNLGATHGTWASQKVRNALMGAGISYDDAYIYLQRLSFKVSENNDGDLFRSLCSESISETKSATALDILGADALKKCFDPITYIKEGIEYIFKNSAKPADSNS